MTPRGKQTTVAVVAGALFAAGLGLGGMTRPLKVIRFLDFAGAWDPSLACVMLGAVATHAVAYRLIRGRPTPLFADSFQIPTKRDIDGKLIAGASLFGVGWGLGGYCPGPAVVSLGSGMLQPFVFVLTMLLGMLLVDLFVGRASSERTLPGASGPLEARSE